jgi:hypothetical protein
VLGLKLDYEFSGYRLVRLQARRISIIPVRHADHLTHVSLTWLIRIHRFHDVEPIAVEEECVFSE